MESEETTLQNKYPYPSAVMRHQVGWTGIGLASVFLRNWIAQRPLMAAIHWHAIMGVGGFLLGTQLGKYVDRKNKLHELVIQDYIRLHPEDFVEPPRRKFKELLNSWDPIR